MIKLIIFDLDGILVDTKDIHFEALNRALEDLKESPIGYSDHINKFDGKPTYEKLNILNIPKTKHKDIGEKKQYYTSQLLKRLKPDPKLIGLFKQLKNDGYILHIASNSIRKTIEIAAENIGIKDLVDYYVSNEDVKFGKPHPEMYLKCMIYAGIGPKETLVIEDSYVGRQGAFNSGAYLSSIKNISEVNYDMIKSNISKHENLKPKWKSEYLNVVIPMAGAGSRFVTAGYTFPKPLIDVQGKPMIQVVVENLNIEAKYIYMVRKEHYEQYNLKYMLEMMTPGCEIVIVDKLTEGAACTILLAKDLINSNDQLLIANSDQYMDWDSSHFMYSMQSPYIDGGVLTFVNSHPKWSYAKVDPDGFITEIKEKVVISNKATCGVYYWKKGSEFVKYAEQMIQKDIRVKNEFYVAPVFNEAIQDGKKFKCYDVDGMMGLGTPEDLNYFLSTRKEK
jgi:HAD superfamily hydrolase (TIGR01509 family)